MADVDDPAFQARTAAALKRLQLDPQPLLLEVSKLDAYLLLAQLQLALRHPGNRGVPAAAARRVAARIQQVLGADRDVWELIKKGWHQE